MRSFSTAPTSRRALGSSAAALMVAAAATGGLSLVSACDNGDQVCPDNTVEEDRDDACPYGPPGGPQRKSANRCELTFDTANCTATFRDDVFPILTGALAPRSGGGCTLANCHGPNTQGGGVLLLPADSTPDQLYSSLSAFKNDRGDPYLEADNPNAWLYCNLRGTIGGGNPMPKPSGLTDAPDNPADDGDLAIIDEWVRCGMKLDGMGTGATTGTGGVGGAGGAGGGL